jgi:ABC-type sugar transport system substrate-binding protein
MKVLAALLAMLLTLSLAAGPAAAADSKLKVGVVHLGSVSDGG